MKPRTKHTLIRVIIAAVFFAGISFPAAAAYGDGPNILHPGFLSGSVSVSGQQITSVTVRAIDDARVYSASVNVNAPGGSSSVNYTLTVEGGRNYYVIAEAWLAGPDSRNVITPVFGSVYVPIYADTGTTVDGYNLTVNPAYISGTITTTTAGNTINSLYLYARIYASQFNEYFYNRTYAYNLSAPGDPGRSYTMPVTPGYEYFQYAQISVNCITYTFWETGSALTEGQVLTRDFSIAVTEATISGTALLQGTATSVTNAYVYGTSYSPPPTRNASAPIGDATTGAYSLCVDAGTWYVQPYFTYNLTGALSGLTGYMRPPTAEITVASGDHVTRDFIVNPGYLAGTVTLTGANTDFGPNSYVGAYSAPSGYTRSTIHQDTGAYLLAASPGNWQYDYLYLTFDYPADPDPSLQSVLYQSGFFLGPYAVTSGGTTPVDLSYGTARVTMLYYVAGGGQLRSPEFQATSAGSPYLRAYAYGSPNLTTEGRARATLFPGSYTIETFANVQGSRTEFGAYTATVAEGDDLYIGGFGRPTLRITNPTDGQDIYSDTVTVEGTATDDVGIDTVTVNGETVTLTRGGNPADPNEVSFNHSVSLPVVGANTITIVVTDTDGSPPISVTLTVIRRVVATPTTLTYTGDALVQVNSSATMTALLVDEAGQPIAVAEISFQAGGQTCTAYTGTDGSASCSVVISAAGVYPVTAQFAGDALHQSSGASAVLVVYNPEGGFVTGGGWILPDGADDMLPGGAPYGKTNFGFIARYQRDTTVPHGNVEFQYHNGNINLKSVSLEWLVLNGNWAVFQGIAMVNGQGLHPFMVEARDGELSGGTEADRFIIKVWAEGSTTAGDLLYKASGDLQGGSIVLHVK